MGGHASCVGGKCGITAPVWIFPLVNLPRLGERFPLKVPAATNFAVATNQIELGWHGKQDYRFLPDVRQATHRFNSIVASARNGRWLRAEARLNPDAGESSTTFTAVDPGQPDFFPAHWTLRLYLRFDFELPALRLIRRGRISVANREPLEYESDAPLEGFPPLNGPVWRLKRAVEFYDVASASSVPVLRLDVGSTIEPVNLMLYDVRPEAPEVTPSGDFAASAWISVRDGRSTRTSVTIVPGRGMVVDTATPLRLRVAAEPVRVEVRGRVVDATEPHLGLVFRPYSVDRDRPGFGRAEIHIPSSAETPPPRLAVEEDHAPRVIRSGDEVELTSRPVLGSDVTDVEYVWVRPHGVADAHFDGPSAHFTAPRVDEPTDLWLTLYLRDEKGLSEPFRYEYLVEP